MLAMSVLRGTDLVCVQILLLVSIIINLCVLFYFHQYINQLISPHAPTHHSLHDLSFLQQNLSAEETEKLQIANADIHQRSDDATLRCNCSQLPTAASSTGNDMLSGILAAYKVAYPKATNPQYSDPTIYISSGTDIQAKNPVWMPEGPAYFSQRCPGLLPWMKCSYSADRAAISTSDAVLYHARLMDAHGRFQGLPSPRQRHQKLIFYETESPAYVWGYFANISAPYWTQFNLTATLSSDSDIPVNSHKVVCRPRRGWRSSSRDHARGKKLAAWIVSHCDTDSKREHYVRALQKYIPVDVYGACSNRPVCSRPLSDQPCIHKFLSDNYKFYLSLENAVCSEYVTEKLQQALNLVEVVPVVLGGADYGSILPKDSYLDVRDFSSPQHLASRMLEMHYNDTLYNEYVERKMSVDCHRNTLFHCDLCQYLHQHRNEKQIVHDATSFWSYKKRCTSPRDFYAGVADEIIPDILAGKSINSFENFQSQTSMQKS